MTFHFLHHHQICPPGESESPALTLLAEILQNQKTIMASLKDIQDQNTALIAAVKDEDTVIDSAVVLIGGFAKQLTDLQAQLAAAIAANDPAALQAVADSLGNTAADVTAKKQALADAVAAGTTPPAA
jgi:hypothetical protein